MPFMSQALRKLFPLGPSNLRAKPILPSNISDYSSSNRNYLIPPPAADFQVDPAVATKRTPRRKTTIILLLVGAATAIIIWFSLFSTLPHSYALKTPSNGINSIVQAWHIPADSLRLLSPWPTNFTRDVTTLSCHSHNDYSRQVQLFDALAAGCTSVEADIWLRNNTNGPTDLLVGHSSWSLKSERTLQSLYIEPLNAILRHQNDQRSNGTAEMVGVFDSSPNTTVTLLLDFKSNGKSLWPLVNQQLEALRSENFLTFWDSTTNQFNWRPLIVVASGNAPFDLLISNTTYRDVFYDAPLDDISNSKYDSSNSYYASASLTSAVGNLWLWKFSSSQLTKIRNQIGAAKGKGIVSRYWSTPSWPVTFRDYIWEVLVENDVGMLNIDDFSSAIFFPLFTRFNQNRLIF